MGFRTVFAAPAAHRAQRLAKIVAGAVLLATLALAAGIVLDEVRLAGREQRLVRGARDAGRALAALLARETREQGGAGLAIVASRPAFVERVRKLSSRHPEIAYLYVLNSKGEILWSSEQGRLGAGWQGGAPEDFLGRGELRTRVTDDGDGGEPDVFVEMVAGIGSSPVSGGPPYGAVVLGLSELQMTRVLRRGVWRTVAALAGFGLAILLLAAAASRALARRQGEEIRKRAQAEHLTELGLLAAGLAHELRNPLNAMRFAIDSLARRAGKAAPDAVASEMVEITREIDDEIAGLERIVSSFLAYARPPHEKPEEVDLAAVARSALAAAGPALERAGVEARLDVPERPLVACLLPGRLRQVLVNLLLNAGEACTAGGRVTVTLAEREERLVVTVEDDGPGVPAEVAGSLFEPFATGRPDGTGLGLAICWRLLSEMGGAIAYQPALPRGSRFTVELPRRAAA